MAFADTDDIVTRLGRDLTEAEDAMAESVIDSVTGQIINAVDRDQDWADDLDPIPAVFTALCVEKVIAVGSNPNQLASESKQLGQYSTSKSFRAAYGSDADVFLSPQEERMVREVIYGNAATTSPESMIDRQIDLAELRDVDTDP